MSRRMMCFSGSFYPNEKVNILKYFNSFNATANTSSKDINKKDENTNIKALIVPHAGYVYSGYTANLAYKKASLQEYKTIVVIGPSHKISFKGASISLYENYETPLGDIKIDLTYAKKLKEEFDFLLFDDEVHKEHSTETQAPFIKHYFSKSNIIEIVYGLIDFKILSDLCTKILKEDNVLLVISTDLSHFYTQEEAFLLDTICLNAIKNRNIKTFEQGGEACGMVGIKALINSSVKLNLQSEFLHYCTSANRSFDKSSVVSYCSFSFQRI